MWSMMHPIKEINNIDVVTCRKFKEKYSKMNKISYPFQINYRIRVIIEFPFILIKIVKS